MPFTGVEPLEFTVLVLAAFGTSIVSALVGMVGGIMLLAVMALFFPPSALIPLHGAVQLASNATRTWIHWPQVRKDMFWAFFGGAILGGLLGSQIVVRLPEDLFRIIIGSFILVAVWGPKLKNLPPVLNIKRRWFLLGTGISFLGLIIGATGPVQAPFYLRENLSKETLIGTTASTQCLTHLSKMAVFGFLGFQFSPYALLLISMIAAVFLGTLVGTKFLRKMSQKLFLILFKGVLTLLAARMIIQGWTQ